MILSNVSVKRPVTVLMFMLIAVLLGSISLILLPMDLFPDIEVPVAIVSVNYSGVAPEEIETLITKPIEESAASVSNLKEISSFSREGSSIVIVQYEYGTDMDFAALELREKVDMIKGFLPDGASTPMVLKIDPNAFPIVLLGISSDMEAGKLQTLIEDEIASRFERIDGVAAVDLYGGDEKEVKIQIDQEKIAGYGISLEGIKNTLQAENLNLPGGTVKKGDKELLVRSMGEFQSIEDIKDISIPLKSGEIIKLSDIAEITYGYKDKESIFRVDGDNSIGLSITKQSVANTVKVSKKVMKEISAIEKEYPELKIIVGMDQAEYINLSIQNVAQNAIIGGILAVIILYLFLRNIRSTFIIGIAIPVSIVTTFALMYFGNLTLNLLSLGGLALGVGMLVDNSIVVLENIYRLREEGYSQREAAVEGAKGVGMAVFASTMTTIAVFIPIVFVGGLISILFKELSFTVAFSLLASLIVSLTVVPMLASKILETGEVKQRKRTGFSLGKMLDLFSAAILGVSNLYQRIVRYTIHHRKITILGAVVLLVASFSLMGVVGAEFFPKEDEGSFTVSIELPYGTSLEESDKIVSEIEKIIEKIPEKETITTTIGSQLNLMGGASNTSSIMVELKSVKDRSRTTEEIVSEVRKEVENIAGARITVTETSSMGGGGMGSAAAIQLEIKGDDIELLKTIGEDFQEIIKSIPGTVEVETNMVEGDPEARIKIDRKKASFYGITAYNLANVLSASIDGLKATTYKVDGDEIDVNLMLSDHVKESVENMKQILIPSPTGQMVPIGQIAEIEYGNSPSQIFRNNQVRTVQVSSQLVGRDLRSVTEDIQNRLETYSMPSGYTYNFTGQQQDMEEAFKSLGLALILSIALIYMILASQFESLIHPLTVMFSVPFALSGGLLGLFLTGRALSVPALIGFIILAGIVVNNAIVLVDYINQLRAKEYEMEEAIITATRHRFRPIMMTTLTTVLGLVPLSLGLGEGGATQAPLATVVIGGLLLSTVLTLAFIPVMYVIFDNFVQKIKSKWGKRKHRKFETKESL